MPAEERLPALARRAPPGSWEHRFAHAVMEAEGEAAKIAAANELLGEAAFALDVGAGWPAAATRIGVLGAMLLGAAALLAGAGAAVSAAALALGVAGAIAAAAAGRASRAEAAQQRRALDALVAAALGPLAEGRLDPPTAAVYARRRRSSA